VNRRRITGENLRLRRCLNRFVFQNSTPQNQPLLVVAGDMNDGPGSTVFQKKYFKKT
jgi:hypothetical protein